MKRFLSFVLAVILCVSCCSCGGEKKDAFGAFRKAYDNRNAVCEIIDKYGADVYYKCLLSAYNMNTYENKRNTMTGDEKKINHAGNDFKEAILFHTDKYDFFSANQFALCVEAVSWLMNLLEKS